MPECLLYATPSARTRRFYRIEIALTLFAQVAVLREWGVAGGKGRSVIRLYDNLRDASRDADMFRLRALRRGYARA